MTPLTPDERAELARIARAATPGQWRVGFNGYQVKSDQDYPHEAIALVPGALHPPDMRWPVWIANSEHIAACNPDTVLRLLAQLDAAEQALAQVREELRDTDDLNGKLAKLLTGVADALKGKPEPLTLHSWHDLPEKAKYVVDCGAQAIVDATALEAERDALRTQLDAALAALTPPTEEPR